jgi:DNA-binding CsgD family transcriptional regulator
MVERPTAASVLLERDEQLALLCAEIEALEAGAGSVLVPSGPAGSGKTALLQRAVLFARDHGWPGSPRATAVWCARGANRRSSDVCPTGTRSGGDRRSARCGTPRAGAGGADERTDAAAPRVCRAPAPRRAGRDLAGARNGRAELAARPAVAARMRTAQDGGRALPAGIALERGELAKARALLAAIDPHIDVVPASVATAMAAASLARAEGAVAAERAALRDLQRLADAIGFATWSRGPWAPALAVSLGPSDEAHELADQALTHARRRARPGEIGIALRAQALTTAEGADIERLRAAVTELEQSELALEHARTLIDLRAALRRRKYRSDARQPLLSGLEQAVRCGATALTDRARTELLASGARPRRSMITGRDALTTSERRIAMLASEGRSNREIAQTLFVTPKTVENHLSHIYQKFAINSRTELPRVLTAA